MGTENNLSTNTSELMPGSMPIDESILGGEKVADIKGNKEALADFHAICEDDVNKRMDILMGPEELKRMQAIFDKAEKDKEDTLAELESIAKSN